MDNLEQIGLRATCAPPFDKGGRGGMWGGVSAKQSCAPPFDKGGWGGIWDIVAFRRRSVLHDTLVLLLLLTGLAASTTARAGSYTITAEMWMQPRSGKIMLQMPPVRQAVADWMRHPGAKLVILHSGDDMGSLWASEVGDWLVSLGIPSADIGKQVSGQDENSVTLEVTP